MSLVFKLPKQLLVFTGSLSSVLFFAGCGGEKETENGLTDVRFQMGWFAQPERGGFFQGVQYGHFEKQGLEVTLLNGGPQSPAGAMLAAGEANIADLRLEEALSLVEKGFPVVLVAAYMQHDPQGIMVHAESETRRIEDLAGKKVLARPGIPFIDVVKKKFDIDFSLVPLSGNGALFLSDTEMAQQCFITNEPFYAKRAGVEVRTFTLADIGFDLFRVIGVRSDFLEENPELVKGFLRGMIDGWEDYLYGEDQSKSHAMIMEMNPTLDLEGIDFAREVMLKEKLISGRSNPEGIGWMDTSRIESVMEQLVDIGFLKASLDISSFATQEFIKAVK
ncbi:MAG: ABC transporter substrate-binding protein [Verrucomicrobiota bacterium]